MTEIRGRGWDIPGGHLEVGEVPEEAMVREVREETGVFVTAVRLFAHQRIRLDGERPTAYRYPFPESYQIFYLARPVGTVEPVADAEVVGAQFWEINQARQLDWVVRNGVLFEAAYSSWSR